MTSHYPSLVLLQLEELYINKNSISSLSPLSSLPNLWSIDASQNRITSLAGTPMSVSRLWVANNQISSVGV